MTSRTLHRRHTELSDFLTFHRQKLSPADVGLPTGGRRRTPGLRREEVAALAGVGLTWYTWFEQGRDIKVSERFLLSLARALKLDDAECCHLFLLAHRRPPPTEAYQWPSVSPLIQQLMDDLVSCPAYVFNLRWDVIAWNAMADRLLGFSERENVQRNIMRMVFTDPDLRRRLPAWHADASKLLGQFRCNLAVAPEDPAMLSLVDDLKAQSPDFRLWWDQSDLDRYAYGIGSLLDTSARRVDFRHEVLTVDEHRHLRMVVYFDERQQLGG